MLKNKYWYVWRYIGCVPIYHNLIHGITSRDIPTFPRNLRGYPDYPNTAKRNYRPTVAW